jgi:hypothetical protein
MKGSDTLFTRTVKNDASPFHGGAISLGAGVERPVPDLFFLLGPILLIFTLKYMF